ncbi:glycoside hydrolase family 6 protein [Microlunatus endophyticus]|uniref:glycoside hydrolase family 6 protein n=1 Tax=Microlunatus endophyticus TaxID=1716077 RepID=UPI00166949E0|nr:glycoside hydrolase family 6 protein [Microlunatus endophyticus]
MSNNPALKTTLVTPWSNESSGAKKNYGFTTNLGTPFRVSLKAANGLVGIRRMYSPKTHDFRYIWAASERASLIKKGYQDASPSFYAANKAASCLIPVYRYDKNHVTQYVTTAAQRKSLSSSGWTYDKVAFYAASATTAAAPTPPPTAPPVTTPTTPATPLNQKFYANQISKAWKAYDSATNASTEKLLYQVAATPTAIWLGGYASDPGTVSSIEAKAAKLKQTPQFVVYAIPDRDCGGYAAGGLSGVSAYEKWINSIRAAIAKRPTIVIVEPDAISMGCLSASGKADRIAMLKYAMKTLSADPTTYAYIHAGSSLPTDTFAPVLKQVGVQYGRGIAVNVSSFSTTATETAYADSMLAELAKIGVTGKHAVVDTSRNGVGPIKSGTNPNGAPNWCNPPGRAVGKRPTTSTGDKAVDAWLWIKPPGESDGQCHPGDPTGWFQSYALDITQRALNNDIITPLTPPN